MSDYATGSEIAAFAQEFTVNPEAQDQLASAASRLFDNLCDVEPGFFAAATGESDKVLYGTGTAYLKLPPYVGPLGDAPIVIVDDDDNEQEIPAYFEQNGFLVIRGYGQGVPSRNVENTVPILYGAWNSSPTWDTRNTTEFTGWPRNWEITVSANWGFTAIPADVKQATIQLAIHLWRTSDPAFTAISQSGPSMPDVPLQAKAIADRYKEQYQQNALFA